MTRLHLAGSGVPGDGHLRFGIEFDWLAVDRHDAVAMFSTSRYRPSPLPTEFVALREPGQLTTGRVRTVAEELEVGTRTVWQWAVGLVKDRLSR